ncbi:MULTISPECIES: ABC transporter ATP-binding protein [Bacillus]|uniref:ABC transporter ATP-binding protein n=1 Tax=Bacillus TaxID=1386 RepID=UPI0003A2A5A0|nr:MULTISPECIES: ABC transporter ATP-binding protein [Bacillus]AVB10018.1 ABC transporter ATP-binding protein [Bacillus velezensis]MCR6615950.1 ABC transporter ATP-binding protein [Bacillus amyloliquefaciens]MCT6684197.1 ABC transporter ATP-binding protein [Bacillus velezensis]MCV2523482.1 ABC transporter ATP-binding protein [Bacillus velezensis]MDQ8057823.1 ABC transporter ATP-binding protein [Bacillus velezensis]
MKVITQGLNKSYKDKKVLQDISFTIENNEIVAVLGPNGVGKTTMLEILMTLKKYDSGDVQILGHNLHKESNIQKVRSKIGVVFQEGGMYAYLKTKEVLDLFASFYDISNDRINEVVNLFSLTKHMNTKYEKLSGGWKKRVLLATAFLNQPELLFLDEPTTGLDPKATKDLWDAIKLAKNNGTTILLSSHSMEEVDMYADRSLILKDGKIAEFDSPTVLKEKYQCTYFKEVYFAILERESSHNG